ncbi:TPA: chromosome partition protein MukE [Pasteurella multocida]|uniref:chromosome partition protein MukE n=1 Tax=Pasteurella multocida TaxID=747 RepID=UPI00145ACB4A|nr:chromosome partition protein MukE [Pasteurella multocida]MCL7827613.1 chromosome partition protein MukE [Pasteurella multocida]NMK15203.1 chromosome partition protein MukE [Pasteurella multocida]URH76625.1 chromosome partition protein MukE [Pasteurella multocida]URH90558.1 chromosome partition protein MukE [Pasteurella multocida]URI05269.1 chromosome partition protein MukE [Pasteurella multocida]
MTDNLQDLISTKLAAAIANPLFPAVDSQLRAGRHISLDQLDHHAFLMDFQGELDSFYRRYNVELIRAPEGFFYLRPKATTLIARSVLTELEMLVGKVLCYLYLSPERLAQQGIFSTQEVYDELLNLADENKLLKAVNQRSSGSDLDKQKLAEKVRAALNRLRRLGMIHGVGEQNSGKFTIAEAVFRFGAEVRAGDDPREAQLRLIRDGEAATPDSLALEKQADLNEVDDNDELEDELDDEEHA